ncbi:serine hydrolase domain-containing protein [Nocardioides oleivorans]|nr:serine hydrolase domain-containing protein [Nocardioides oleivorans]
MTTARPRRRPAGRTVAAATALAVAAGLLGATGAATAAPAERARTDQAPTDQPSTDRSRTEMRSDAVERLVRRLRGAGAVAVDVEVRRGDQTWSMAAGSSQVDPRRPAVAGSAYRAGSVSKQLVSVLALQLVDRGTWTLDTTIGEVAPGLWPGQESVTVRQLLSHTSGLPEFLTPLVAEADTTQGFLDATDDRWTDAQLIAVAQQLPVTAPGEFSYSNTNYVVLGQLLTQATGRSVAALAERRILRPAGMGDSFFADDRRLPAPRLAEYARLPRLVALERFHPSMFSSAGSLVSTTTDLNDFHAALESGRLIPRRLVRTMQREVAPGSGYGLGSYSVPNPCRGGATINGHDGGTWGTVTFSLAAGRGTQVTVAMTGRSYVPQQYRKQLVLSQKLVSSAFAMTCPGRSRGDGGDRRTASSWPATDGVSVRVGR